MDVLLPVTFAAAQLTATTATDSTAAYNAGTTYALGAEVYVLTRRYESLQNGNLAHDPASSPTWWVDIGPLNQYAMFDTTISTQTTDTTALDVEITPGAVVEAIAFLNVTGATLLTVNVYDHGTPGETLVYTETIDLDTSDVFDWYSYFFAPFEYRNDVVLTGIPPYSACVIEAEFDGGSIAVGAMIYGRMASLGTHTLGTKIGIRDYSVKSEDDFGNTVFTERAFSRRMGASVFCSNVFLPNIYRQLSEIRAVPTVWIGSTEAQFAPMIQYGYAKDWNIDVQYRDYSLLSIDIEGLT